MNHRILSHRVPLGNRHTVIAHQISAECCLEFAAVKKLSNASWADWVENQVQQWRRGRRTCTPFFLFLPMESSCGCSSSLDRRELLESLESVSYVSGISCRSAQMSVTDLYPTTLFLAIFAPLFARKSACPLPSIGWICGGGLAHADLWQQLWVAARRQCLGAMGAFTRWSGGQ